MKVHALGTTASLQLDRLYPQISHVAYAAAVVCCCLSWLDGDLVIGMMIKLPEQIIVFTELHKVYMLTPC